MEKIFRKLFDRQQIDLVSYVKNKIEESPELDLFVGCDSQNHGRVTTYAIVVVLHKTHGGGHVLYTREDIPMIRDVSTRIWKEVEMSLDVAEFLVENGIKRAKYIDIDMNPDKKYKSNMLLAAAMGLVKWKGFEGRSKPDAVSASYVADKLCKRKNKRSVFVEPVIQRM